MRNPKSLVTALIVTVGLYQVAPFFALIGACLFVCIVFEGRRDAKVREFEENTVRALAAQVESYRQKDAHAEAIIREAQELRAQAMEQATRARALREETERQLVEFAQWRMTQITPTPQELFDGMRVEQEIQQFRTEIERYTNGGA